MIVPNVKFAQTNKLCTVDQYKAEIVNGMWHYWTVKVNKIKRMTTAEFDAFANDLMSDRDWMKGHGGIEDGKIRHCILVVAPDRPSLYIDPQGYEYARYVGL